MASKENQMSLDIIAKSLPFEIYMCYIHTLQQAIDDLELKDKALKLFIKDMSDIKVKKDDCFVKFVCTDTDCKECIENNYLTLARKKLENGK